MLLRNLIDLILLKCKQKRKEERGKRKEERGKRKEKKLINVRLTVDSRNIKWLYSVPGYTYTEQKNVKSTYLEMYHQLILENN